MKKIAILGSTGSIGTQTLEIVRKEPDLQVTALAAGANGELMEKQVREFHPSLVAMWTEEAARDLKTRLGDLPVRVVCGMEGLLEVAVHEEAEVLVTAIVGMIGIRPTIAAIEQGKTIALANKETLVTGRTCIHDGRRCTETSELVDGEESHDRLSFARQQRTGSDGGEMAV